MSRVHVPVTFEGWVAIEEVDGEPTIVGIDITNGPVKLRQGVGGPFAQDGTQPRESLTAAEANLVASPPLWQFRPEHIDKVEFEGWTVFEAER